MSNTPFTVIIGHDATCRIVGEVADNLIVCEPPQGCPDEAPGEAARDKLVPIQVSLTVTDWSPYR